MTTISRATDQRRKGFFILDNEIVRDYGAKLGPFAGWVYAAIVYHADGLTGEAFPGIGTLAKETGMSRRKVMECISRLEELNLIRVQRDVRPVEGEKRQREVNHYFVLDVKALTGGVVHEVHQGSAQDALGVVHEGNCNNTQLNQTQEQDLAPDGAQAKPAKVKPPKPRDLLFEAICEHIVGVPYEKAPNGDKNYTRAIYNAIRARVPDGEPMPTPEDAVAFKANYLAANPTLSLPRQAGKIADWLLKLRVASAPTSPTPAPDGITPEDIARTLEQMNAQEARYYDQPA